MACFIYRCATCKKSRMLAKLPETSASVPECCGAQMDWETRGIQTKGDDYKEPLHLDTMEPIWHNGPVYAKTGKVSHDVVHSDSELRKWERDYERKTGEKVRAVSNY